MLVSGSEQLSSKICIIAFGRGRGSCGTLCTTLILSATTLHFSHSTIPLIEVRFHDWLSDWGAYFWNVADGPVDPVAKVLKKIRGVQLTVRWVMKLNYNSRILRFSVSMQFSLCLIIFFLSALVMPLKRNILQTIEKWIWDTYTCKIRDY